MASRLLARVVLFGLFSFGLSVVVRAAENRTASKPLDIDVRAAGFGNVSSADITAVLESVTNEIWRYCPTARLSGIDVYHRSDHPQTNFERQPNGHVAIGLTAKNTYWAQYSFQFAHEFCHALANYSDNQQFVRYPRHANLWLQECLCETASLFALRAMSRSWRTYPTYPAWRGYAPWLDHYVEQRLVLPQHHLPAGKPFLVWFRENEAALRQNPDRRDRNTIVAIQFLPIFEAEPRGWEALAFLNRASSNAEESLAQRFAEWRSQCPKQLRPFVTRLAKVFAVKLDGSKLGRSS